MSNQQSEPVVMIIFGVGGDLTWRKLIPALYNLFLDHHLPRQFAVIGIDQKESSEEEFRLRLREGVKEFSRRGKSEDHAWHEFADNISLKGVFEELKSRQSGMMTLVAVAITTAYVYSSAVVFGLVGKIFFWELASVDRTGQGISVSKVKGYGAPIFSIPTGW